jgi:hypothetical protein
MHDSERSHHQLNVAAISTAPNNDFDQVEIDRIRVPSALRKECAAD